MARKRNAIMRHQPDICRRIDALRSLDAAKVVKLNWDLDKAGVSISDVFEGDDFIGTSYWLTNSPDDKGVVLCGDYT